MSSKIAMSARRPAQGSGKTAAQVTKGSVGTSTAARNTRPAAPGPATAAKQSATARSNVANHAAAKARVVSTAGSAPPKRPAAPAASSAIVAESAPARVVTDVNAGRTHRIAASSSESRLPAPERSSNKAPGTDVLQEAAQICSWLYMASTLEDVRRKTEKTVLATLERQSHELAAEEAAIADARIRFETEQLLKCYDVLSLREAPALRSVTLAFLLHEADCAGVSQKIVELCETTRYDLTYLRICDRTLETVDSLLITTSQIVQQILNLPDVFQQEDSQVRSAVNVMLSVVRERSVTLSEAWNAVDAHKKLARLHVGLQSLTANG